MTLASYQEFLTQFDVNDETLLQDLVVHGKRVFHDPQRNQEWADKKGIKTHSVGLFLGEARKTFQPTPYCLERISKLSEAEAVVDAKGAWLFLCGRDIFGKALKKGTQEPGKPVFLYDEGHNLLGYGLWTADTKPNKVAITHKADKGIYLRRR